MLNHNRAFAATLVFLALGLMPNKAGSFPVGTPARDEERLGPMRRAGLRPTPEHVSELIAILRERPLPSRFLMETTLLSLGQLGATNALPDINTLIESSSGQSSSKKIDSNVVNAAKAARARIVAEGAAGADTGGEAQAEAKLENFYTELGETPADLNAAMINYTRELPRTVAPDSPPHYPVELYALRQLSDMTYHSGYKDFTQLPGIAQVRFDLDPRAAIKVHLAPLSAPERVSWLVQNLSNKATFGDMENAEVQLAGDLGPLASSAASVKLQEMAQHREQYKRAGFNGMFGILTSAATKSNLQSGLEKFKTDADPIIAEYARDGGRGNFVAGY